MGNKVAKEFDTTLPTITWDKENNRPKYYFPDGTHVFNFYGEYSRDEFLKANVDEPEFEKKVKEEVEHYTKRHYYIYHRTCKHVSHYIYYKDQKYGFAWFNMAFIEPMCTINLLSKVSGDNEGTLQLKIQRFLCDERIYIKCMHTDSSVKWSVTNADVAANYICDMTDGLDISIVENDLGIQESKKLVKDRSDLQSILKTLIEYMMSIKERQMLCFS